MSPPSVYLSEVFASFQGEGSLAGYPQLFIRLAGCNLRCSYCDTGYAQQLTPQGRVEKEPFSGEFGYEKNPIPEERLLDAVVRLLGIGKRRWAHSLAVTGGEPLTQAEGLAKFLGRLREEVEPVLPVMVDTNGTLPDGLRKLNGLVDYVVMDVKLPSVAGSGPTAHTQQDFLRQALRMGTGVCLKLVVSNDIGFEEMEEYLAALAEVCAEHKSGWGTVPLFLQPVTRPEPLFREVLVRSFASAREYFDDVRVLPQTHKMLKLP